MSSHKTPLKDLIGKVAIVTGSSRGIGAAIALKLAAHGADVVINYHSSTKAAEDIASQARDKHGVRSITVKADVSKETDIARLFEITKKEFGRIDIVMSNSGIEHFNDIEKTTAAEIDKVFDINVKAQFFVAQKSWQYMENGGRLILISSISAQKGFGRHSIYSASKAAVQGMVKCLAWDLGPKNITVNCLAPGGIKSDMYDQVAAEYFPGQNLSISEIDAALCKWSPLGRVGMPDDVAGVVALLASPESQWLTGQTFQVGGGALM